MAVVSGPDTAEGDSTNCGNLSELRERIEFSSTGRLQMSLSSILSLNDRNVLIISLFLLSLILPLAIFLTKVFFRDRRAYAAKVLANEFPALA